MADATSSTSTVAPAAATPVPAAAPSPPVAAESAKRKQFPVSLTEFCKNLSKRDRRVELISMFHFTETQAGKLVDTPANFQERFVALSNKSNKSKG
jgi:hypothetical protein